VEDASQPGSPDRLDLAILELLAKNARRTFGDIGATVGLSAPAVKRRIDRLEASGIIRGYTTVVDHAKLGRPLEAFTELRFSGNARVDAIANIGSDVPEVVAVFTVAGDPDALVWIRVRDVQDLKRVVDKLRSTGDVTGTKTMMVLGTSTNSDRERGSPV
jgi:Lrp/AsnC family transcriptional regulator, leucine-responsive regulatory protein